MKDLSIKARKHYHEQLLRRKSIPAFIKWGQIIEQDTRASNILRKTHLQKLYFLNWTKKIHKIYQIREDKAVKFNYTRIKKNYLGLLINVGLKWSINDIEKILYFKYGRKGHASFTITHLSSVLSEMEKKIQKSNFKKT